MIVFMAVGTQLSGNGLVTFYLSPILRMIGITKPVQQGVFVNSFRSQR
jgi:hypothetical protein